MRVRAVAAAANEDGSHLLRTSMAASLGREWQPTGKGLLMLFFISHPKKVLCDIHPDDEEHANLARAYDPEVAE